MYKRQRLFFVFLNMKKRHTHDLIGIYLLRHEKTNVRLGNDAAKRVLIQLALAFQANSVM